MNRRTLFPLLTGCAALLLWTVGPTVAGEHPEHPSHGAAPVEVTMEMLGDAIEAYVAWDSELHGGFFYVRDARDGVDLALKLDMVHRARLASLGNGVYFACADFQATNGHVYDLDVFMEAKPGGPFHGLVPTEVSVHKKDGAARYRWAEKNGVWTKAAAK